MNNINSSFKFCNKTAYHYCSIDALFKILTTKSLWLASLSSTNDKLELKIGRKIINDSLDKLIVDEPDTNLKNIFKLIRESSKDRKKSNELKDTLNYFAASFVAYPDSLTHWERYGNDSNGVCIEFNWLALEYFLKRKNLLFGLSNLIQQRDLIYNEQEQAQYLKEELLFQINALENLLNMKNKNEINSKYDNLLKNPIISTLLYHTVLSMITPIFKHQGFSDEKESRLFFLPGDAEITIKNYSRFNLGSKYQNVFNERLVEFANLKNDLGLCEKDIKYAPINNRIRSLYILNLSLFWNSSLIPRIIIGPKCTQNIIELKKFVKSIGLTKTKINVSKIPIR